jgi:DNA modification methylase
LKRGELCYEPFAGSGPQFVAAEQLQRRCNGLEIEPKFVAVILERMQKLGLEPKLAG